MTPTPSTFSASSPDEHPEVSEISALSEGILPVERQEEVRAHLASCELCADVRTSLDEIREVLGTLPGAASMPEDVANRIDAAIAAEALLDSTTPDSVPATGDSTPPESPRSTREPTEEPTAVSRETARTGTEAGEAGTTQADTNSAEAGTHDDHAARVSRETRGADRPAGHPTGPTGPGRSPRTRGDRRSRRWRTATLIAAASVAVLGIGGLTIQSLSNSGDVRATSGSATESPRKDASGPGPSSSSAPGASPRSGIGTEDRQLEKRVQGLLSHQDTGSPSESGSRPAPTKPSDSPTVDTKRSPSGDNTLRDDRAGGAGTAPSCVRDGIQRTESPLAIDADATYEGQSGYLVVLPHEGGDPQRVDAYLVDPSCVSADPSAPGRVLLKRTYPRG